MKIKKFQFIILLFYLIFQVNASVFSSPIFNFSSIEEDLLGRVDLNSAINPKLIVENLIDDKSYNFTINPDGSFLIDKNIFKRQGTYKFYFQDSSVRFPQVGYIYRYIGLNYDNFTTVIQNFTINDSFDAQFARPISGFNNSAFALFHVREILKHSFSNYYFGTNTTLIYNLMNANWATDGGCNKNVYNCEFRNYPVHGAFSSAKIQGDIISSLWDSYMFTRIPELKSYALNFTKGMPLADCNAYTSSFICNTPDGQAAMIKGFSKAYLGTGNLSYLIYANNFALANPFSNSSNIADSLILLYELNQDESLLNEVLEIYNNSINLCKNNCNLNTYISTIPFFASLNRIFNYNELAYLASRSALNTFAYTNVGDNCRTHNIYSNNYLCRNSLIQTDLMFNFFNFKHSFLYSDEIFYDIRISPVKIGESINISFKLNSYFENLSFFIRDFLDHSSPYINFSINPDENNIFLNSSYFQYSTFYEFYFERDGIRFPKDKNFYISIPALNMDLEEKIDKISSSNPIYYCNPFDNLSPSYSCRFEYMQGAYISSLSFYQNSIFNPENKIIQILALSSNQIDLGGFDSTCDPFLNDFKCEAINLNFINNPLRKPSAYRSASLIKAYIDSYKTTKNETFLNYALNIAGNVFDECNLYNNVFNCGIESQGILISAFYDLYSITGDDFLKEKLNNLINYSMFMNDTTNLLVGLSSTNEFLNETHTNRISNYIINNSEKCLDNNCSIQELYNFNKLVWTFYPYLQNKTFFEIGNNILRARPISLNNYCDPNSLEIYESVRNRCLYPNEQALLLSSYISSYINYVDVNPYLLNISILGENEGNFNNLTNITCIVKNTGERKIEIIDIFLLSDQNILDINTSNSSALINGNIVRLENFSVNNSIQINYTINLTTAGRNNFRCAALNFFEDHPFNVSNIGKILNFSLKKDYVDEISGYFLLNISNDFHFALENILINFSNYNNTIFANSSSSLEIDNDTILIPFINAYDSHIIYFYYNFFEDEYKDIYLNLSSDFQGYNFFNFTIKTLKNNLSLIKNFDSRIDLYKDFIFNLSILNDKLFNFTNLSLEISFNDSDWKFFSLNKSFHNISINNLENISYLLRPMKENVSDIKINFFHILGLNFSNNFSFSINTQIIEISVENNLGFLNQSVPVKYIIKNPTMENLYNLSISSYFDNSSILLTNMTPPYILMKDNEFGNFTSFNSSDTYNISILDFLKVNDSNFHSINSFNYTNSSNSTNLSFLNISVSFENVFQELYLRVYSNISLNSSGEIYIDDIGPFYCDILCNLSNLNLEKNFSILFLLKNENFSTNKTWNISYIELYSTYTYRNYSGIKLNNYSLFLDELLLNSSKNFTKDFTLFRDIPSSLINVNISSDSIANANYSYSFTKLEEIILESGGGASSSSPKSSGGGGFIDIEEINESFELFFNYTEFLSFENFYKNDKDIKNFFNQREIFELNFNNSKIFSQCILIKRKIDIKKAIVNLEIENICDHTFIDLFILENLSSLDYLDNNLSNFFYFSKYSIISIPELSKGNLSFSYFLNMSNINDLNETFSKISLYINDIYKEKNELIFLPLDFKNVSFDSIKKIFDFLEKISFYVFIFSTILSILFFLVLYLLIYFLVKSSNNIYIFSLKSFNKFRKINSNLNNLSIPNKFKETSNLNSLLNKMNLKIIYISNFIKKDDFENAKTEYAKLIDFYKKNYFLMKVNYDENSEGIKYVAFKINEFRKYFQVKEEAFSSQMNNMKQNLNNSSNDASNLNKTDDSEEKSKEELDIYLQIKKIKELNDSLKLDEAEDLINKLRKKIDILSDDEKKTQKDFLNNILKVYEEKTLLLKKNSLRYKSKKIFKNTSENIVSFFHKE